MIAGLFGPDKTTLLPDAATHDSALSDLNDCLSPW